MGGPRRRYRLAGRDSTREVVDLMPRPMAVHCRRVVKGAGSDYFRGLWLGLNGQDPLEGPGVDSPVSPSPSSSPSQSIVGN